MRDIIVPIDSNNQGFFSATNPNNPALLTVNPSVLFFNQIAAASIQNNSVAPAGKNPEGFDTFGLRVPDGKSLLLVGGNVNSDAVWEDTRLGATTAQRLDSKTTATKPKSESDTVEIIPATGWVFNGKGEVTLVSQTPNATVENLAGSSQSCRFR